jgi:hypothetical protein
LCTDYQYTNKKLFSKPLNKDGANEVDLNSSFDSEIEIFRLKKFTSVSVECADWSVEGEGDTAGREHRHRRLGHVQSGPVRVDERQSLTLKTIHLILIV